MDSDWRKMSKSKKTDYFLSILKDNNFDVDENDVKEESIMYLLVQITNRIVMLEHK